MLWFLIGLLALYGCFLEITLQADVCSHHALQMRLRLHCAGLHKTWQYHLQKTPAGHRLMHTDSHGVQISEPSRLHQSSVRLVAALLRRADVARRFLLSHLHLERLDVLLHLRTGDAAHSALLSGAMQGLRCCIPVPWREAIRICVLPEFFRPHSTINSRCIIRFRLGTIILTAMMLLAAYVRQHLQESEESAYGTSHR